MSVDRVFVDTNVLAYLFDEAEPDKRDIAAARLEREREQRELVVSTQVLQELYVCLTRGKDPIATAETAERAVRDAARLTTVQVDVPLVFQAIRRTRDASLSFWDALIVEAALASRCNTLLSEDMNDGQVFEGLCIENPFATAKKRSRKRK